MGDNQDDNDASVISDLVHDAVVPHAHAVKVLRPAQLHMSGWTRVVGKRFKFLDYA